MSLQLPRLQQSAALVDEQGLPTQAFQIWWNTFAANLEQAFNALATNVAAIAAAQAAATAAQTTANTAQSTANTAKVNDKISASATVPSSILSAADAGTSATVTISGHTRDYGDATVLSGIAGGTVTGLAYSTLYGVYYDDVTTSTITPSYQVTTDLKTAQFNYVAGRHFCGQITTPASGGGSTTGSGPRGPGGGGPYP